MAQLSRPYQVVLLLVAVAALAWFTLLRSHVSTSSSSSGSSGSPSAAAQSPSTPKAGAIERNQAKPTKVYHGAAPGLQGLSKDIKRAHEAVGASEAQAQKLAGATGSSSTSAGSSSAAAGSRSAHTGSSAPSAGATAPRANGKSPADVVSNQLRAGKVVLLLFWNPRSSDDGAVHTQLQAASHTLKGKVATDYARPKEVGAFGTVTRNVSVLQTPTLLVINHRGLVTTITGLTDAFAIEQAVREARG